MALVLKDRVKETTTSTGTGTINLAGAASGFQTFVAGVGSTNTTYYAIEDANGTAWEVGLGTVTDASPDTLSRTIILDNSNGDTDPITLSTGTHTVFGTYPAGKAVYLDATGVLSHAVTLTADVTGTLPAANGGTGLTSTSTLLNSNVTPTSLSLVIGTDVQGYDADLSAIAALSSADGNFIVGSPSGWVAESGATARASLGVDATGTDNSTNVTLVTTSHDYLSISTQAITLGIIDISDDTNLVAGTGITLTGDTLSVDASQTQVTAVGTIATGTWQGTAIAQAYIANDAINGDKIADDVVDSEHYVAGSIDEEHLNSTNSPTDNYLLSYDDSSGGFTWVAASSGGEANEFSFKTISVSGQDDVVADTTTDTLTLAAGSNVTITTTAASDTVTIAATDTNTMGSGFTVSATTDSNATTITQGDDLMFAAGTGITCETTADGTVTISSTVTDTNTMGSGFTVSATTDSNATTITQGDDLMFAAGTGITCETTADGTVTITNTVSDTNTTYTGGTNLTLAGTTFNVDDAFLVNDADDTTTGTITAGGFTTAGTLTVDSVGITAIQTASESFADNDTSLMTSAAIDDRINSAVASEDTLAELNDTNISSAAAGHLIIYDNTASVWDNAALTAGSNISITNGDGAITIAATDTNTTYTGGTNLTLAGTTFNVDDAFLINNGDDTTTGVITAGGFTTTGTWTFDEFTSGTVGITTVQDSGTTFDDNDTSLMTAAAIADKIEAYGYSTTAGDITGVTAGTGLSGGGASGAVTLNVDASQTQITAVGTIGTGVWQGTAIGASYVATLNQNTTGSAATLTTPRAINGVNFDGSAPITVTAAGSTLSDTVTVAKGGTGQTSYTNGQLLIGNTTGNTLAKSTLTAGSNVTITNGTGTITIAATDTNTTYTKASFDLDHLFTLVGASADTDEHLSTFTGSTISDNQTIKQALQALETAVETKGTGTVDVSGTPTAGHVAIWSDADTITFDSAKLFWDTSSDELGVGTSSPGSTLHVSGSVQFKAYTVGDTGDADWSSNIHELHDATKGANYYILCDTGNTNRTVELPDASSALAGRTYVIKKIDAGPGTVTIQPDDNDGTDGYLDRDNATVDDGTNILWTQFDTISCTCGEGYTDGQYEWHIVQEKVHPHTAKITMEGDSGNIANDTETQVSFDNLDYAVGCGTTITGGTRKITINRNGKYSVKCQIAMNNTFDNGDRMSIYLYKNGSLLHGGSTIVHSQTNKYVYGWFDSSFDLVVDDYLQVKIHHWNGENAQIYNKHQDASDRTVWDPFLVVEEIK